MSTTREMLRGFIRTHFPTHVVDVAAPGMRNQTSMNFDAMGGMNPWGGFDGYSLVAKYGGMLPNGMMMPPPGSTVRLLPIRPRSRCERRSLRTFPVVALHPRFPFNVRLTGKTFD